MENNPNYKRIKHQMKFFLLSWCPDYMNISLILDCQIGITVVLFEIEASAISNLTGSFLAFLTCRISFRCIAFLITTFFTKLNATSISIFFLLEPCSILCYLFNPPYIRSM